MKGKSPKSGWLRIREYFEHAIQLDGRQREDYLHKIGENDPQLVRELRSLLYAHQQTSPLDAPSENVLKNALDDFDDNKIRGMQIGAYQIKNRIGYGGMGDVFLAERCDGEFEHQVALKVLRNGLYSDEQIRRFRTERQILASLNHDNIARLYDGGVTENGLPYFVMELVEGEPIDHYCDNRSLGIAERIQLFMTVCYAVQTAHNKLIVHRDLKPSNILVTNSGSVKLLDFGISGMAEHGQSDELQARSGLLPLSPSYASPEQVRGDPISTASDIYQLGMVLHELLTGVLPYDVSSSTRGTIEQIICEREPSLPSRNIKKLTADHKKEMKGLSPFDKPEKLARQLRGELDAIIEKTLRKVPEHRYNSAGELAGELNRYLKNRPVKAHPDSIGYRSRKFLSRHRWGAAFSLLFIATLIGYAVTITSHSQRTQAALEQAHQEAEKSGQVIGFMMDMFEANDPAKAMGDTVTAAFLLEQGAEQAEKLDDQPEVQGKMYEVIGNVYRQLDEYEQAHRYMEKSLDIAKVTEEGGSTQIADRFYSLGSITHQLGDYRKSDRYFEQAIQIYEDIAGHKSTEYAGSLYALANIRNVRGDYDQAEQMHRRALRMRIELEEENHLQTADSYHAVGYTLYLQDKFSEAYSYLNKSLGIYKKNDGAVSPAVAEVKANLSRVLQEKGEPEAAEQHLKQALDIRTGIFGEHHSQTGISIKALADFYRNQQQYAAAEARYLELYELIDDELGENHPLYRPVIQSLGNLYMETDRPDEAEPMLREALSRLESVLNAQHPRVLAARRQLSKNLGQLNRFSEAESLLHQNLDILNEADTTARLKAEKKAALEQMVHIYHIWGRDNEAEIFSSRLAEY